MLLWEDVAVCIWICIKALWAFGTSAKLRMRNQTGIQDHVDIQRTILLNPQWKNKDEFNMINSTFWEEFNAMDELLCVKCDYDEI